MEKKIDKKKKKKRVRVIRSLVMVVAFVVAIAATFGVTMAYFGGTSAEKTGSIVLRDGLYINNTSFTSLNTTQYVVPSQNVPVDCGFTVKSAKAGSLSTISTTTATQGLIRATITVTDSSNKFGTVLGNTIDVKQEGTVVATFVKDTSDSNYYLMPKGTTAISDSVEMYVVDTTKGEQTYTFDMTVKVSEDLVNADGGSTLTFEITYAVIQADFYSKDATEADEKYVSKAKPIFNATSGATGY